MSAITLRLLGAPQIELDGKAIDVDTRKATALFAYLALHPELHRRDAIAAMFWPESDQSRGRTALRRTLSALNKALGSDWSLTDRETVQLNPDRDLWIDVRAFQERLASCRTHGHQDTEVCPRCLSPLSEAVALVGDNFMAGFGLRDSPEFDDWQYFQAEGLRQELGLALKKLVSCHVERREFEEAIANARRWLALDPLNEPAHRHLMQLYAWVGRRAAALRQYQELARVLEEELGAFPLEETIQLYERIRAKRPLPPPEELETALFDAVNAEKMRAAALPGQALVDDVPPDHNLPHQSTPFVGREAELADIAGLLDQAACRLLTLIGPGGIGKTRLALQAATNALEAFRHGVFFVALAAVSSPDYLAAAIAESLHFEFYGRDDLKSQLLNYLREKELLLVLDNFEHMRDQVELVADVLQQGPQVKILVTSQERLNLQQEWLYEIQGLSFPQNGHRNRAEAFSAVQLFVERAKKVQPDFDLGDEDKTAVTRICQLVAGMPLGIELAAGWVRVLPPGDIAREIENNLDFLSTSLRDVPERHRSLRAVFEHSWRLLTAGERATFRRLSVFHGGFRRAAAEAVAGTSLPTLLSLANKSFLRRSSSGRGDLRYDVPEPLSVYAEEQSAAGKGDGAALDEARAAHAAYFTAFVAERETALRGGDQKQALEAIAEEIENIRTAWRWAVTHGEAAQIDRALAGLYRFYEMRSWFEEGQAAFETAVAGFGGPDVDPQAPDALLIGKLLARGGRFAMRLSRNQTAHRQLETALTLLQQSDQTAEVATTLSNLGVVMESAGDYAAAGRYQKESLALARQVGDRLSEANALVRLGNVAIALGDYPRARGYYEEGRTIYDAIGYQRGIALCLNNLGGVADKLGEYDEAARLYEASLAIKRELGDRRGIAFSLNNLGFIASLGGDLDEAEVYLDESADLFQEIGDRRGRAYALNNLGNVARRSGEHLEAQARAQEALAIFREIGDKVGIAFSHTDLGRIGLAQGDANGARDHFQAGAETALAVGALPVVLDALAGMAAALVESGQTEQAAALAGAVLAHDASQQQAQAGAGRLLARLEAMLPPERLAEARARGAERPLDELVALFS